MTRTTVHFCALCTTRGGVRRTRMRTPSKDKKAYKGSPLPALCLHCGSDTRPRATYEVTTVVI
jgi:hypothetical protein